METKVKLRMLLAEYPVTRALHQGKVMSDLVTPEFAPIKKANLGFKAAVRELAFDAGEIAIATFLQAKERGVGLSLLPATILGRFQHHCIAYNSERGALAPSDLAGKTVGVRAYTQTTGMWVRGFLAEQYGVDPGSVTWLTFEDAHVPDYTNPPNVVLSDGEESLADMLLNGELDAAILGMDMPEDPRLQTVVPDPERAARAWYAKTHAVPVNHMAFVRTDLCRTAPEAVRAVFALLKDSKARARSDGLLDGQIDMFPYGLEALRPSLELAIDCCLQQRLIGRRLSVEELFDDVTRELK